MLDKLKELHSKHPYLTYVLGGLLLFIPVFIFSRRRKGVASHAKGAPIQVIPSSRPTPLPFQEREKITRPHLEDRVEKPRWASDIFNVINNNRKRLDKFAEDLKNDSRNNEFLKNIEGRIKEKQIKRPVAPTKLPLAPIAPRSTRTHVQGIIPQIFNNVEKVTSRTAQAIRNMTQAQKDLVNRQYRRLRGKMEETGKSVEEVVGGAPARRTAISRRNVKVERKNIENNVRRSVGTAISRRNVRRAVKL